MSPFVEAASAAFSAYGIAGALHSARGAVMHLLDEVVERGLPDLGESTHKRAALC